MNTTPPSHSSQAAEGNACAKKILVLPILAAILLSLILVSGCMTHTPAASTTTSPSPGGAINSQGERVEVYHFHRTQQCYSCKTVGALAEETVTTRFENEMASGGVVFGHINIELPENKALVDRYGPTGPSLWIGVYDKNGFHKEEDTRVWYKIGNKDDYMTYLEDLIQKRIRGDFS